MQQKIQHESVVIINISMNKEKKGLNRKIMFKIYKNNITDQSVAQWINQSWEC